MYCSKHAKSDDYDDNTRWCPDCEAAKVPPTSASDIPASVFFETFTDGGTGGAPLDEQLSDIPSEAIVEEGPESEKPIPKGP